MLHRRSAELPAGEATPVLQPLPRAAMRHSQRLAVPASAQPPTLLVADIAGLQVGLTHRAACVSHDLCYSSVIAEGQVQGFGQASH